MRFNVTYIEFDLDDDYEIYESLSSKDEFLNKEQLRDELECSALGIWDASDEDDLIEQITELSGWCIKSIDYKSIEDSNTLNNMKGATL